VGFGFLVLLNGGYWLDGLRRTQAARAQDEAENAKRVAEMLAEINAPAKGRQSQNTGLLPNMWGEGSSQPAQPTDTARVPWWVRAQGPNGPSSKK
jgi:hypothetical protein